MKYVILSFVFFLVVENQTKAQFEWGLLLGASSVSIKPKTFVINNDQKLDSFSLAFKDANYGFHFGGFVRLSYRKVFIQPEFLFNSNNTTFTFKDFTKLQTSDSIRNERYQRMDIPLMVGAKFGIFRLNAGPVAHFILNNRSDLVNIEGYDDKFKSATYGYQLGLGFDFGLVTFDLRHEGNFSKYGDHVTFFGKHFASDKAETRLIGTFGLKF